MRVFFLCLLLKILATTAPATTVFDSGMPTTINTMINDDVVIRDDASGNGTDVTLGSDADITAQAVNAPGITVEGTSTLTVEGGKVVGSSTTIGGEGIRVQENARLSISDGEIIGGESAVGVLVSSNVSSATTVAVSGGKITGGENFGEPQGANGLEVRTGSLTVAGGTFVGGQGNGPSAAGGFGVLTNVSGLIAGGTFIGGDGSFSPGAGLGVGGGTVNISGGMFVSGAGDPAKSYAIIVSSGSILNLKGGVFDGNFLVGTDSILNVFGDELTFENSLLTGKLQSGQPISVNVDVGEDGTVNLKNSVGTVFPPQVPLPSTLPLLAAGLGAVAFVRRRSKQCSQQRVSSYAFRC